MSRENVDQNLVEIRLLTPAEGPLCQEFSCGDADLDDFLRSDALRLADQRVVRTYVAFYEERLVGYVAVLADAIKLQTGERKKLGLNHGDHPVIPAIKVARIGVCKDTRQSCRGLGMHLMKFAAFVALGAAETHGCRLLTVDAYPDAVTFYEKLGFVRNKVSEHPGKTLSMRFDLFSATPASWIV